MLQYSDRKPLSLWTSIAKPSKLINAINHSQEIWPPSSKKIQDFIDYLYSLFDAVASCSVNSCKQEFSCWSNSCPTIAQAYHGMRGMFSKDWM